MSTTTQERLPMSQAEYARTGNCCPFCRSTEITGGSITITEVGACQEVSCDDCDKEWTDTYSLIGYEET